MIPRRIDLTKSGNNQYMCQGTSCDRCKVRFECFTVSKSDVVTIDWDELHKQYKGCSPALSLKEVIGSRVFVHGSKKFKALMQRRQEAYIVKLDPKEVERMLEIIKNDKTLHNCKPLV